MAAGLRHGGNLNRYQHGCSISLNTEASWDRIRVTRLWQKESVNGDVARTGVKSGFSLSVVHSAWPLHVRDTDGYAKLFPGSQRTAGGHPSRFTRLSPD